MSDLFNSPPEQTPDAASFGTLPNPSATFGKVPQPSETFRSVPNDSASFRTFPKPSERTANHTLTVREVARMFEEAGVSRTERSIVNWCLPNKHDVSRLDGVYDANERKWFITHESVDRAIAEEQARAARHHEPLPNLSETVRDEVKEEVPHASEARPNRESSDTGEVTELHAKLRDLEITTRVKDAVIKKLEGDLHNADEERKGYIQQLIDRSHRVGSLESQLLQLSAPKNDSEHLLPNGSEARDRGRSQLHRVV